MTYFPHALDFDRIRVNDLLLLLFIEVFVVLLQKHKVSAYDLKYNISKHPTI